MNNTITKLAIVGSRSFNDYNKLKDEILKNYDINNLTTIISGGAKGTDTLAEQFAKEFNLELIVFKPDYKTYYRSAPLQRNTLIINECESCIAFPTKDSKGTLDSIKKCKKQNKHLIVINL